jgi:hypothetical protein
MALDNIQRAVLSIAALSHLAEMKRRTVQNDATALGTLDFLERLVINGSVSDRDEILSWYEQDESFDKALSSKRPMSI